MNIEDVRYYCLNKKGVTESFPFNETALVFKVGGKMFALLDLTKQWGVNLKSIPEKAIELREKYDFIIPGYHMNKKHWNTVLLNKEVNFEILKHLIDSSYNLIVSKLSKKEKSLLETEIK